MVALREVVVAAALFALLAPTAGLLVDQQLAGWSVDHGHAGVASALATHSHPYDHDHTAATSEQPGDDASEVSFTLADDAGAGALVLAREPASLPANVAPAVAAPALSSSPPAVAAAHVPTPPPRG